MADAHRPTMSSERQAQLRQWHESAMAELRALGEHDVEYLGLTLHVPEQVFPPAPMSELLGRAVTAQVRPGDRVLDVGTGSGVNAILAAKAGARVVAVDVNPVALAAASANAAANEVGDRVEVRHSDVFDGIEGRFDLIVFDPPFRWFRPADLLEQAVADEGYVALGRFVAELAGHLTPEGCALVFFGTTGDLDHLAALIDAAALSCEVIGTRELTKDGGTESYFVFRLTPSARFVTSAEVGGVGGVVVVIDVLRAFTTAAYAFAAGAAEIWLVAGVDEAIELAERFDGAVVMGEDGGLRPEGFTLSNSPVGASRADLAGRTVVQRTSAGTQGVVAARSADRLFVASLVCASATARAIDACGLGAPTYVISGDLAGRDDRLGEDDRLTAELIERVRLGQPARAEVTAAAVAASSEAERTLALGPGHVDPLDVEYATQVDRFDLVMEVERLPLGLRLTAR